MLKAFLEIFSSGETNAGAVGSFKDADFDQRKAWLVTNIKGTMLLPRPPFRFAMLTSSDIIRMFGAEVILLWSALIMKKRVAVYCEKLPILLKFVRCVYSVLRRRSRMLTSCTALSLSSSSTAKAGTSSDHTLSCRSRRRLMISNRCAACTCR